MTTTLYPAEVRSLVRRTFLELAQDSSSLDDFTEDILIQEGKYYARSYRTDNWMAMWLVEIGLLQFYDADGNMLRTVNLLEKIEPVLRAA